MDLENKRIVPCESCRVIYHYENRDKVRIENLHENIEWARNQINKGKVLVIGEAFRRGKFYCNTCARERLARNNTIETFSSA